MGAKLTWDVPEAGQMFACNHAVWRVLRAEDRALSDDDRTLWLDAGMPDLATWCDRPRVLHVQYQGGARPDWAPADDTFEARFDVPASKARRTWYVYPESGRWPQCSCCGEPMPCRAEREDEQVAWALAKVERHAAISPGCCWACAEPITTRQRRVSYPGDNLDLPGAPGPSYHLRGHCRPSAITYERRWITVDPRRERILTWPPCGGLLLVHADGSSDCVSGEAGCGGHLTHDHAVIRACWYAVGDTTPGCLRGCPKVGHPGARPSGRPERRDQAVLDGAS